MEMIASPSLALVDWTALVTEVEVLTRSPGSPEGEARVDAICARALESASGDALSARSAVLCAVSVFHTYATHEPRNAVEPAKVAVRLAEKAGDRAQLRRALNIYGIACGDTSDPGMAIHCYVRALNLAVAMQDVPAQCAILTNLGTTLMASAAYEDALECLRRVKALAATASSPLLAHIALGAEGNMALCCLHLERPEDGIRAMSAAMARVGEPVEGYEFVARVLTECTYTRLLLTAGRHEEARTRAMLAARYAAQFDAPRARIAAQNAIALVEVFEGHFESGMRRLNTSLAMTSSMRTAHRDTLAALVMASEHANRIDLAISFQRELLDATNRQVLTNVRLHDELHRRELVRSSFVTDERLVPQLAKRRLDRLSEQGDRYDEALDQMETLERIAATAAMREDPSGGHPYRVARLVSLLAAEVGIDPRGCRVLDLAARLHDIGNVGLPDRLVLTSASLSDEERTTIESHTILGFELLDKHEGMELDVAAVIARGHHERWDGGGYPDRLSGDQIPLAARMTALAESFDALVHPRAHRSASTVDASLREIESLSGTAFDPALTRTFVALVRKLRATHRTLDEFLEAGARGSRYLQSRREISDLLRVTQPA